MRIIWTILILLAAGLTGFGKEGSPTEQKKQEGKTAEPKQPVSSTTIPLEKKPVKTEGAEPRDQKPVDPKSVDPKPAEKKEPTESKPVEDPRSTARSPIAPELIAGQAKFAHSLYAPLAKEAKGNLAYSPFSVSQALSLVGEGARGETAAEIDAALQVRLAAAQRHAAIAGLNRELARAAKDGNELSIANGLWGQTEKPFLPEFLRAAKEFYGAEIQQANFRVRWELERREINEWVAKATAGKIAQLLPSNSLDTRTRIVLVNAIYLKASWSRPFNPELTSEAPFQLAAGKSAPVSMMRGRFFIPYAELPEGQIASLPCLGQEIEMVILLPKKGLSPDEMVASNPLDELDWLMQSLADKKSSVALELPRCELQSGGSVKSILMQLGMKKVFDPKRADLSALAAENELVLGDVFHSAKIELNEKGAVAAGATAGVVVSRGPGPTPFQMTVDRPFAFVLRHVPTGTILFVGRVNDPGRPVK